MRHLQGLGELPATNHNNEKGGPHKVAQLMFFFFFKKKGGLPPQTRYSHDLSIEHLCRLPGARAQAPEMVYTIVCTLFDTKHSQSHKHHGPLCMFSLMGLACTVIVMCLVFSVSFLPSPYAPQRNITIQLQGKKLERYNPQIEVTGPANKPK